MSYFRMPAEWEQHRATWIAWPYLESDFPGKIDTVRWAYCEFIRHAARVETVEILCLNEELELDLLNRLARQKITGDIRIHCAPYNRSWLRDSGPIGIRSTSNGENAWVSYLFTGWGALSQVELDQGIPNIIAHASRRTLKTSTLQGKRPVLEGGMLDVSGDGLIVVTEECLLSEKQQRNVGFSKLDYERIFAEDLGAPTTLWLPWGMRGDDTHGHIDNVARFIAPRTIVVASPDRSDAQQYARLRENIDYLQAFRTPSGEKLEVIELSIPAPRFCDGEQVAASYLNFYLLNNLALVPTYNDPLDYKVLGLLSELLPNREVVGIYCGDWILGGGTLHCSTQQEPASQ
jgi:agmatine deiminase